MLDNQKNVKQPASIRTQLIGTLLIGLPILFLLISIAVSIPLYQQIFHDEDESMKQFAQLVINERTSISDADPNSKKHTHDGFSLQSFPIPPSVIHHIDNPQYRQANSTTDMTGKSTAIEAMAVGDMIFAETFELSIWDKSGKLIENSQLDIRDTKNAPNNKASFIANDDIKELSKGFHNLGTVFSTDSWRLYLTINPHTGETIAVAQPLAERMDTIVGFVGQQMLLLFCSLPLLIAMVIWSVHKGLRPLNRLTTEVQQRHASDLAPVNDCLPHELQPLATALNQLFVKVAEGIEIQTRFTADASHELKSPITAIKVQANELQHHLQQNLSLAETEHTLESILAIQRIQTIADRASHLIEQLLTLTKLDDKNWQHNIDKQTINWLSISEQALQSVSRNARKHEVKLIRKVSSDDERDILPITNYGNNLGNTALLSLMLRNLLDNAISYGASSARQAKDKKVELTLGSNHITIRDYGKGIGEEHQQRIRERFFRPAGQTQTGSGLGLSIADRVAQLHGLNIVITNHQDGGVLVTIHSM